MLDCVTRAGPAITPATAASARADAEHQHEDAPDIVAEMADHVRMGQRRLHDQADPRALQHDQQRHEDHDRRPAA